VRLGTRRIVSPRLARVRNSPLAAGRSDAKLVQ